MTLLDRGSISIAALVLVASVIGVLWLRWRRHDEEFVGLTPGLLPSDPAKASTRRVRGGLEWNGSVAVAFQPPRGIGPAVAGTVVDGVVDPRYLAAMLVDLSLRGYFRIEPRGQDWEFQQNLDPIPNDQLSTAEIRMLRAIFRGGPTVLLSTLKQHFKSGAPGSTFGFSLRETQIDLYREMIDRGWYRQHPRSRGSWATIGGISLLMMAVAAGGLANDLWKREHTGFVWAVPIAFVLAAVLLFKFGGGRVPRTASGTAARIQTLGFEKYLATAEADQIRYEEAAGLFTRYLPFAIAFGLADRWAGVISEVMRKARFEGLATDITDFGFDPLAWYAMDGMINLAGDGLGALIDMAGSGDGIFALGDITEGFDMFASSATDMFDDVGGFSSGCTDGCDGCDATDGCDVGCIDF